MKSEFRCCNSGFTIVELLLFMTINSLLATIALPSLITQANKAKQSEAKTIVGAMNRAQQAYYLENRNVFAPMSNFKGLGLGIATQTKNSRYGILGGGVGQSFVTNQAIPSRPNSPLKAYIGGVAAVKQKGTKDIWTMAVLCEADKVPANGGIMSGIVTPRANAAPLCPARTTQIK